MTVNSKSILYSLILYTTTLIVLMLIKIRCVSPYKQIETLPLDYIGSYGHSDRVKNDASSTINKDTSPKIDKITKTATRGKKTSNFNKEQDILAKEFATRLPSVDKPTETTIQVVNENALYKNNNNNIVSPNNTYNTSNNNDVDSAISNGHNDVKQGNNESSNFNIEGRTLLKAPEINDKSQQTGIIAVSITVDNKGNVVEAKAGAQGTTIPSLDLWRICEQAALKAKYNPVRKSISYQTGIIRFRFITY